MNKQQQIDDLISENLELKRELYELRCRYGDLADLVSEVACDFEAKKAVRNELERIKDDEPTRPRI